MQPKSSFPLARNSKTSLSDSKQTGDTKANELTLSDQFNIPFSDEDSNGDSDDSSNHTQADISSFPESLKRSVTSNNKSSFVDVPKSEYTQVDLSQNWDSQRPHSKSLQAHNSRPSEKHQLQLSLLHDLPSYSKRSTLSSQDILQSLIQEEKTIEERMEQFMKIYTEISQTGSSPKSSRSNILEGFKALYMLHQAMSEVYEKEVEEKTEILENFRYLHDSKEELLQKADFLRSPECEEGFRLDQLQKEFKAVSEDIDDLETRLKQLKDKRRVLRSEINKSESVIESRASSYLEGIRGIEKCEQNIIDDLKNENDFYSTSQPRRFDTTGGSLISQFISSFSGRTQNHSIIQLNNVHDIIEGQIASLKDGIKNTKRKEEIFHECSIVWESVSSILGNLEAEITSILQSPNPELVLKSRIENAVRKAYETLEEREETFGNTDPILFKSLQIEKNILKSSLELLKPKSNSSSVHSTRDPSESKTVGAI